MDQMQQPAIADQSEWPARIINLHPREKLRLAQADPARYVAQVRSERQAEAEADVNDRLGAMQARRT